MKDPVTVPSDLLWWAIDRLEEAGLKETEEFQELEECAKQVRWEPVESTTH